jgi:hypothetical protein
MTSNAYEQAKARTLLNRATSADSYVVRESDPLRATQRLVYNAGIAKESYFRSHTAPAFSGTQGARPAGAGPSGLWGILRTDTAGNSPAYVDQATSLWSKSQAYKGLITTYRFPGTPTTDDKVAAKTTPLVLSSDGSMYGFQFHYNPGSVAMSYGGIPEIDPTMYTAGIEKFNALGANVTGSYVSFTVILNRINDMKYFNPATGKLKSGISRNVFSGRAPDDRELSDIYNRGTMYDLEFLLRTIVGVQLESYLGRGMSWDKKTADLGWLTGKPVELHLGKSLRYLGRIENIQLNHVLFTERMIPTFSEVQITFQRIPDYTPSALNNLNGIKTPAKPKFGFTGAPSRITYNTLKPDGIAYNTYTNEFGQLVKSPVFDGTFG